MILPVNHERNTKGPVPCNLGIRKEVQRGKPRPTRFYGKHTVESVLFCSTAHASSPEFMQSALKRIFCVFKQNIWRSEYLYTDSNRAPEWENTANLAYLAIINGRRDGGQGTDMNQCEILHLAERTREFQGFFCFLNLDTLVLVCPENQMGDSYEFCHRSLLGMLLKKLFVHRRISIV